MKSSSAGYCLVTTVAVLILTTYGQNLNSPVFDQPFYQANVSETTKIGFVVLNVVVADVDLGIDGKVSLRLNSTSNFNIEENGDIVYDGRLDYEIPELREITLAITASDGGSPPRETTVLFYVSVLDENDSKPTFSDITYRAIVINGTNAGEFVMQLEAHDKDSNSNLTFSLAQPHAFFNLDPLSGIVTTSQLIDKASVVGTLDTLSVAVQVSDGLRRSFARIQITILDTNWNDPTFETPLYAATITERDSGPSMEIIKVTATDGDSGDQATVTYSLSNTSYSDQFIINRESGKISFIGMIDRDVTPEPVITLDVVATDSGHPTRSANATVQFSITDIDDNGPKFSQRLYYKTIGRDFPKDAKIYIFPQAMDIDKGENSVVFYNLSSQGAAIFNMNNLTRVALTRYSCKIRCALSNATSFQVTLFAWNANDPNIEGDSTLINITLKDPPTTTLPSPGSTEPTKTGGSTIPGLTITGDSTMINITLEDSPTAPSSNPGSTEPSKTGGSTKPGLTITELIVIVVVSCVVLLVIFVVILVLLLRRSKTQRKKDRIDFNPSNYPPEKVENEVPCE